MKLLNILFGCTFVLFNIEQIEHGNRSIYIRDSLGVSDGGPDHLPTASTETKYQTKHQPTVPLPDAQKHTHILCSMKATQMHWNHSTYLIVNQIR